METDDLSKVINQDRHSMPTSKQCRCYILQVCPCFSPLPRVAVCLPNELHYFSPNFYVPRIRPCLTVSANEQSRRQCWYSLSRRFLLAFKPPPIPTWGQHLINVRRVFVLATTKRSVLGLAELKCLDVALFLRGRWNMYNIFIVQNRDCQLWMYRESFLGTQKLPGKLREGNEGEVPPSLLS